MQLGSIAPNNSDKIGIVADDFNFSPLEKRVVTLEERQKYLMIALALLALYVILKK
jgi:hypothetical protein